MPMPEPATVARGLEHVTWLVLDDVPGPRDLGNGRSSPRAEAGDVGMKELHRRVVSKTILNPMG